MEIASRSYKKLVLIKKITNLELSYNLSLNITNLKNTTKKSKIMCPYYNSLQIDNFSS